MEKSANWQRYALIIGILVLAFSLSLILRIQPAEYGLELAEFDPFFNYRATQFIVENGLSEYKEWNDDLSWYPFGRDVSTTSQVMLHTTSAMVYKIFGMGTNLYDFVIWFPAIISSLSAVVIFAIVRTIGGTTAGFFASLFFAVSPIIIMRGSIGWFKSEPLGIFYGLLAIYLLLSGIKSDNRKIGLAKVAGGGLLLAFGLSSWGGIQFFILPIGFLFLALPFLRKDNRFIILTSVIFTAIFLLVTVLFEEKQLFTVIKQPLNGFFLIGCTAFLIACVGAKKISGSQLRYTLGLLGGSIIAGITIISSGIIDLPAFRYLNAANPFLITTDMLTDSVSEHATTTIDVSFFFFSILMIFAGIGAWFLFQKKVNHILKIKHEMAAFALMIGFLGVYFSSAFVRLEVFGAISVIILSSIGISILISKILKARSKTAGIKTKISFLAVISILLTTPMVYPEDYNWSIHNSGIPLSILHSGSQYNISTNDWPHAMAWLKENSPEDAVIAAWWDYGYWISTLSDRTTLADNSTLLDWQIKKIATTFFSTPDNAWKILTADVKTYVADHYISFPNPPQNSDWWQYADSTANNVKERQLELYSVWRTADGDYDGIVNAEDGDDWYEKEENECDEDQLKISCPKFAHDPGTRDQYPTLFDYWKTEVYVPEPRLTGLDADYILVNLVAQKLSDENIMELYTMRQKGGDETKAFWFIKIADLNVLDYYQPGLQGYTDRFWNDTLLGKLIPFTPVLYVDPDNPEIQSETFKRGYVVIYVQDVKFPAGGDGPFELVYVSPSFETNEVGALTGPLIYKINKDYNPP